MGTDMSRWSDVAMFKSERHDAAAGPKVHLLAASADPLGQVAACAKMYLGEVVRDLADITDEERRHYLAEIQKTKLAMPLESITMHFMFENVTRAFTHQLVRQRTAAYAQESMRFAVVEDMTEAVALPPSLAGTLSRDDWLGSEDWDPSWIDSREYIERYADDKQKARFKWDETVEAISEGYNTLVNAGVPAEDARGLMPTNIITRINYLTNFRGLLDHAGNRLCLQAQQEWRAVFAGIAQAMREYGKAQQYRVKSESGGVLFRDSDWQWAALADCLRPVCYQTGDCAFKANFDRACRIRPRVEKFAANGVPSSQWDAGRVDLGIPAIRPVEWFDPDGARVNNGETFDLDGNRVAADVAR